MLLSFYSGARGYSRVGSVEGKKPDTFYTGEKRREGIGGLSAATGCRRLLGMCDSQRVPIRSGFYRESAYF